MARMLRKRLKNPVNEMIVENKIASVYGDPRFPIKVTIGQEEESTVSRIPGVYQAATSEKPFK